MSGRMVKTGVFLNVYFPTLVGISCLLPLTALFFCVVWSVLVDFEKSTATECKNSKEKVWNFLPSISEATGRISPQIYVWRIFIALHASPRFAIAAGYYRMHCTLFQGNAKASIYQRLTVVAFILHMTEIMSLVGLSFISSTENYEMHKFCFETFMLTSLVHMIIMCVLFKRGRQAVKYSINYKEVRSSILKQVLFLINVTAFVFALYFFYRHNKYCENGVYSLFGLFEIIIVVSNIAFHGTAMIDFSTSNLILQDMER